MKIFLALNLSDVILIILIDVKMPTIGTLPILHFQYVVDSLPLSVLFILFVLCFVVHSSLAIFSRAGCFTFIVFAM